MRLSNKIIATCPDILTSDNCWLSNFLNRNLSLHFEGKILDYQVRWLVGPEISSRIHMSGMNTNSPQHIIGLTRLRSASVEDHRSYVFID